MANSFTITLPGRELITKGLKPQPDGTLPEIDGVKLAYKILGVRAAILTGDQIVTVELTVLKKPFYVSLGMIEDHVKGLIAGPK